MPAMLALSRFTLLDVFIISMLPVSELRGAIPYGLLQGAGILEVFLTAIVGNILVIPAIFLFLETFHSALERIPFYKRTFDSFLERSRRKTQKYVEKYGYLGLALFVAVPLPVTGAYTGTLAAWFFGMKKRKAFYSLALGVIIAGVVVSIASLMGAEALGFLFKKA